MKRQSWMTITFTVLISTLLAGSSLSADLKVSNVVPPVERPQVNLGDPNTCAGKITNAIVKALYGPLGLSRLEKAYLDAMEDKSSHEFFGKFLKHLAIKVAAKDADLNNIPKEGPLLIYANHPFGFTDGAAVLSTVARVRPDVKVVMNEIIQMPGIKNQVVSVSIMGSPQENAKASLAGMKEILKWVKDGHAVVVFPSGDVAYATEKGSLKAVEGEWKESLTGLAEKTGAPVLPVFVHGQNSAVFQKSSQIPKIGESLRLVQIPRENTLKEGSTIKLEIGAPIKPDEYAGFPDKASKAQYLRARTLALENRDPKAQVKRDTSKFRPIPHGPYPEELEKAIEAIQKIPGVLVTERGDSQVFMVSRSDYDKYAKTANPRGFDHLMDEIGRLRELTFREAGEGTGKARDLDSYDDVYSHLFAWDKKKGEIIGAYRLGLTDQVTAQKGIKGLFTLNQFNFDEKLLERLGPSLDLDRSFVRKEYQGSLSGLPLLFQGIATFVGKNPQYRHLFGPVSISNDYSDLSKQLMMNYVKQHHAAPDLASLVSGKNPPVLNPGLSSAEVSQLLSPIQDIKQLGKLVSQIEPDGKGAPVLLRRYTDWYAKFLSFDFDRGFNTVDGFIVVDMVEAGRLDRRLLDNTMGKELAQKFMSYHESH